MHEINKFSCNNNNCDFLIWILVNKVRSVTPIIVRNLFEIVVALNYCKLHKIWVPESTKKLAKSDSISIFHILFLFFNTQSKGADDIRNE